MKKFVLNILLGTIGGICGSIIYPFIKHWDPLILGGSVSCVVVLCIGLSIKFDADETPRESFAAFKARKMREKELKKRHQQKENENA